MPKNEPPEFDINKVAAEFVKSNIENFVKLGTNVFKTATHKFQLRIDRTYKKYFILPRLDALFEFIGYKEGEITIEQFLKYAQAAHITIQFGQKNAELFGGTINQKDGRDFSALASFTLKNCGAAVGWKGFQKRNEHSKCLIEKYGSEDASEAVFNLSALTAEDEFAKDLFEKGSFFSVQPLQIMQKVRHALKEKAAKKEASLDEILKRT